MGIKDISKFFRNDEQEFVAEQPLTDFRGTAIAIDASFLNFRNWQAAISNCVKNVNLIHEEIDRKDLMDTWINITSSVIDDFLSSGVIPVFCYDGKLPHEKVDTQKDRKSTAQKKREQWAELREQLDSKEVSPLDDNKDIAKKLATCAYYVYNRTSEEYKYMQDVVQTWGIPTLQAKGEAERLCSALVVHDYCSTAFSGDTDLLVHGCPYPIRGFKGRKQQEINGITVDSRMAEVVCLPELLEGHDITFDEFRHLCFTLGCDYNTRIRGIGPVTAMKKIREFGSIDNFPFDTESLNLDVCERLFAICEDIGECIDCDGEELEENLVLDESKVAKKFYHSYKLYEKII